MKKIYSFLIIGLLLFTSYMQGQTSCSSPVGISWTGAGPLPATTSVPNTDFSNDYGCISPADNAYWLYFQACISDSLSLIFASSCASSGFDVNMIAWGPLTSPTDCGLNATQILDCSTMTGSVYDTLNFNIVAGSYYKILVSNPMNLGCSFSVSPVTSLPVYDDTCNACTNPVIQQEICQVTTDPILNKNIIIWEKDTTYTGNYIIEKETTTMGIYSTLAIVMNNDTSAYIDSISNPMIQSFNYRIDVLDSCNGNTIYGNPHQTIHLLTSISSSTGYPQLSWNYYYGFAYYTYYIFRGSSPATLTLYDSISASFNSYTDVAAVPGMNYYSVSVLPAVPCQPSRAMNMFSYSNVSPVAFTGINEYEFNQLTVGPNPANDVLNFTLGNISADISIDIIDITGRIIFSKSFENVNQDVISLNEISNGSYVVRFTSENKTTHRNIIIAR